MEDTIIINITAEDYYCQGTNLNKLYYDKKLWDAVTEDWGDLANMFITMAIIWMKRMKRTRCQIEYNQGNGSIGIGKHGMGPVLPRTIEDIQDETAGYGFDFSWE